MQNSASTDRAIGIVWLKLAVIYLIVGVALGIVMGASQNFTLRPVHAHLNLLGWATMAIAGLVYCQFPEAGNSKLGKAHFWFMQLSVPVMMISLALLLGGNEAVVPALVLAEFAAAFGVLAFAANIFKNLK